MAQLRTAHGLRIFQCTSIGDRWAYRCPDCGDTHVHKPYPGMRMSHCPEQHEWPWRAMPEAIVIVGPGYAVHAPPPAVEEALA